MTLFDYLNEMRPDETESERGRYLNIFDIINNTVYYNQNNKFITDSRKVGKWTLHILNTWTTTNHWYQNNLIKPITICNIAYDMIYDALKNNNVINNGKDILFYKLEGYEPFRYIKIKIKEMFSYRAFCVINIETKNIYLLDVFHREMTTYKRVFYLYAYWIDRYPYMFDGFNSKLSMDLVKSKFKDSIKNSDNYRILENKRLIDNIDIQKIKKYKLRFHVSEYYDKYLKNKDQLTSNIAYSDLFNYSIEYRIGFRLKNSKDVIVLSPFFQMSYLWDTMRNDKLKNDIKNLSKKDLDYIEFNNFRIPSYNLLLKYYIPFIVSDKLNIFLYPIPKPLGEEFNKEELEFLKLQYEIVKNLYVFK